MLAFCIPAVAALHSNPQLGSCALVALLDKPLDGVGGRFAGEFEMIDRIAIRGRYSRDVSFEMEPVDGRVFEFNDASDGNG